MDEEGHREDNQKDGSEGSTKVISEKYTIFLLCLHVDKCTRNWAPNKSNGMPHIMQKQSNLANNFFVILYTGQICPDC